MALDASPRQAVKGSLHLDIGNRSAVSIRSSHRSIDEDGSPSDLKQCVCYLLRLPDPLKNVDILNRSLLTDRSSSAHLSHVSRSLPSDSRLISCAETLGGVSRSFPYPSENQSIMYASPVEYMEPATGTTAADEIHGNITKQDAGYEEHASALSVLIAKFAFVCFFDFSADYSIALPWL